MAVFLTLLAALSLACIATLIYRRVARRHPAKAPAGQHAAAPPPADAQAAGDGRDESRVRILFGTQTGTAEKFANQIAKALGEAYGEGVTPVVEDLEEYAFAGALAREAVALFVVATYGDGDPTDSAMEFDGWLTDCEVAGEAIFEGLQYGVFALGNTEYEHFCAFGKKVDRTLEQLGAERIVKRTDGDDSSCIEDDLDDWIVNLLAGLDKRGFAEKRVQSTNGAANEIVPAYDVVIAENCRDERKLSAYDRTGTSGGGSAGHTVSLALVDEVRELHSNLSERSCVHVVLNTNELNYEPGDHVAVVPENSEEIVQEAAKVLGVDLDTVFTLKQQEGNPHKLPSPFPGPVTLRTALKTFADLTASPRKSAFPALAAFATNQEEAQRLKFLCSADGKAEYKKCVLDCRMSLLELFQDFPSVKPTLGAFFASICPRLQPRYYSISSSPAMHPNKIHITAAVVDEVKPSGRPHKGVCTNWLKVQAPGAFALIHVRKSHFRLPSDPEVPVIMVGPGAGLAPFRGFLQERSTLQQKGHQLGPALLFFGCRSRKKDYIYEEELQQYLEDGVITELYTAFSRDQEEKDYVQHHLFANRDKVWAALNGGRKGVFYVCGEAAHMARDVHDALRDIVQHCQNCTAAEAENVVKALGDQGRYQKDIW
ncbi:unnamed protein product [Ostreobium quekettii]|uniref:NADPH--hemoprotein reductase n=1 Tax=Ostreobium quekettii TaxID=121088 RepID=A0A8S1IYY9_9CHLO|nr:unnamed protein product [Ostreobium quekettii]|eukprot:evm.model.scf_1333EXC.3 EVM.evm.TU.scf_1333EXC.3   scf_1333EXC:32729-38755(-)